MATELDYMEYGNDNDAQATYVSSEADQQQTTFSQTLTDAGGSWPGYTIRQLIASANLDYDGYRIAIKFQSRTAINALEVLDCFIGHKAGAGDPWDFDGNQVRLTFDSGSDGFSIGVNWVKTSDFVAFDLDETKDLIVSFALHAVDGGCKVELGTTNDTYYKAAVNEAGETTPDNYSVYSGRVTAINEIYVKEVILQSFSEDTIKEQGTYSLKGLAVITESLNDTLTRTVNPTIDLTDQTQIKYDIRGSRTGSQIKIGIHDSGGTTTEHTANIASANTWQTETWDISGVSNANKDAIDSIIITVVNADAGNTFYIDNMYAETEEVAVNAIFFGTNF